jgi:hypothetical protein
LSGLIVLQHAPCETLGSIEDALTSSGHAFRYLKTYAGDRVPDSMGLSAGLIAMGGPMGVYEQDRYQIRLESHASFMVNK